MMPELGEIQRGHKIGKKSDNLFIWHACVVCGRERWVWFYHNQVHNQRCRYCWNNERWGDKNPLWKGGRHVTKNGYIEVVIHPDDFYYPMTPRSKSYVLEHRLVMAKHLNRCLLPWEVVHHKNGIKTDNRIENLQLLPIAKYHLSDTRIKGYVHQLEKRIEQLEDENGMLKFELGL